MNTFNRQRHFFNCPPDCEKRKPGCQDHCRTYLDKRAELDALNAAEKKKRDAMAYTYESVSKRMDRIAKLRREFPRHRHR